MEFDNIETIKQAISVGAGVSILPQPTILKEVGNRTLAAIPLAMTELVRPSTSSIAEARPWPPRSRDS